MTSPILSACPAHPVDSVDPLDSRDSRDSGNSGDSRDSLDSRDALDSREARSASGSDAPPVIERLAAARLPTRHGDFTSYVYRYGLDGAEHLALVKGDVARHTGVLVRLHSECLTGDVFGSMRCDCGEQLDRSLAMVQAQGCGAVIYLRGHEGRGIGLTNKIRAYALQDGGRDTVDANSDLGLPVDSRRYDAGAAILRDLEILSVRLMSNNPRKFAALEAAGMKVVERVPLKIAANPENVRYLEAKRHRLGHFLAD